VQKYGLITGTGTLLYGHSGTISGWAAQIKVGVSHLGSVT
jgi:hypothetical protein